VEKFKKKTLKNVNNVTWIKNVKAFITSMPVCVLVCLSVSVSLSVCVSV